MDHEADARPITDLLPSHRHLLDRHWRRLVDLMGLAVNQALDPTSMSVILAEGLFASICLREGCGFLFLIPTEELPTVAIPLGCDDGLVLILQDMIPEAVGPVMARPVGSVPILIVDRVEEAAILFVKVEDLMPNEPS